MATPMCDALEQARVAMRQDRCPAYGDALSLARKLEVRVAELEAELAGYKSLSSIHQAISALNAEEIDGQ